MKKLVIFLIGLTTVFSLSAQRLNSRGEKMVSHISNKIHYQTGEPYYATFSKPYDIYFYYDSNDEINKIKAIFPTSMADSIVITKGKNGIIWKNYYNKNGKPVWEVTHKVFLDDEGRVSKVESIINDARPFEVSRRTYRYHDKANQNKDVCLDVEIQYVLQPANGPEYGKDCDAFVYRGFQMLHYDGGLTQVYFQREIKTDEYVLGPDSPDPRTIIGHFFPNETNMGLNAFLFYDIDDADGDCLLLLSRWIPIKGDFLPLEFWTTWRSLHLYYTDCIYNRNGDLTNIHVYVNAKPSLWYRELIEDIEIEYVQ